MKTRYKILTGILCGAGLTAAGYVEGYYKAAKKYRPRYEYSERCEYVSPVDRECHRMGKLEIDVDGDGDRDLVHFMMKTRERLVRNND